MKNDRSGAARGLPPALVDTARRVFGIEHLREPQQRVIERVLAGMDTLALMPSGAGKSLCYQLPALWLRGCTVVVSPLIALMKDQADKLGAAGIDATQFNSAQPRRELARSLAQLRAAPGGIRGSGGPAGPGVPTVRGAGDIVFTTPERLADPDFVALLQRQRIVLFVIDEVHCISQWGHDFRPAFLEIGPALRVLHDPPVLALTATADDAVIADIRQQLGRPQLAVIDSGSYRANLKLQVAQVMSEDEKFTKLRELLQHARGAGIVYTATVKACIALHDRLAPLLEAAGERCTLYHGQLRAAERRANQDAFMGGAARMVIATNAFGMGIDKRDLRLVVHYQLPGSLAQYYQEAGRAGRDGEAADCALLYWRRDRQVQQFFLARRYPDAMDLARLHEALAAHARANGGAAAGPAGLGASALAERVPGLPRNRLAVALKLLKDGGWLQVDRHRIWRLQAGPAPKRRDFEQLAAAYCEKDERDREALERMVFYAQTGFCRWRVLLEHLGEAPPFGDACGRCDNCLRAAAGAASDAVLATLQPTLQRFASAATPLEPRLAAGDAVRVPRYGLGRVAAVRGDDEVAVRFPDGSERRFVAQYVIRAGTTLADEWAGAG